MDTRLLARLGALTLLLALLPVLGFAQKTPAKALRPEAESFYAVYMQKAKIGTMQMKRDDKATRDGKPAVRSDSEMVLDLRILGAPTRSTQSATSWADPKTGKPIAQISRMEAAGRITTVTATYTDRTVDYVAVVQGETQKGSLKLAPGEEFLFDTTDSAVFTPKVGTKLKGKIFVPDTLTLMDAETEVVSKEPVDIDGQMVTAYKVLDKNKIATTTLWLNDAGDVLRFDGLMGMRVVKEPKLKALAPASESDSKVDLAMSNGITPTGIALEKPRTLRTVRYEISGVTRSLPPTDSVQSTTYKDIATAPTAATREGEKLALVTVTTGPLPTTSAATLFAKPADAPAALQPFLQATVYVPSGDEEFKTLAHDIVGTETDTAKAAAKIAAYVHKAVKPDPSIAALRTARDIKKDPRGVCRDYTTLFAAIARAAGLPTKQCSGVVFANGLFLYHAWPEVWVGNDTWVALEPTFGLPFADAAHIKLAEGEITDLYNISADMGSYKIKVLSAD